MAEATPDPEKRRRVAIAGITVALMIAAFLLGYVPKQLEASRTAEALRKSERALRLATLHRHLGVASHEAQRNDYRAAAQAAHTFFDGCKAAAAELDLSERPRTRLALESYAASAPEILTQLNLGNPAMKEQLSSLYLTMHGVIERSQ